MTLPIMNCETERNFSDLSIIKNKFQSTVLDEKLHCICILSIENYITRSLSYEEVIRWVRQVINNFFCPDLVMYVLLLCFFIFVVCCDLFSHSK
jgi:hypothetical protein